MIHVGHYILNTAWPISLERVAPQARRVQGLRWGRTVSLIWQELESSTPNMVPYTSIGEFLESHKRYLLDPLRGLGKGVHFTPP